MSRARVASPRKKAEACPDAARFEQTEDEPHVVVAVAGAALERVDRTAKNLASLFFERDRPANELHDPARVLFRLEETGAEILRERLDLRIFAVACAELEQKLCRVPARGARDPAYGDGPGGVESSAESSDRASRSSARALESFDLHASESSARA